jgi:cytochrome c-type biogenesis protein CcmE
MSRGHKKVISGVATLSLLVGGVAHLFVSAAGGAFEYYKHVDEIMAQPAQWEHNQMQMHGFVVPGSIKQKIQRQHSQIAYEDTNVETAQAAQN